MALEAGTRLGHYEVVSSLGAGGMGEVYRAKDTKLGREVAIKLLLDEVSQDAERLARFEREARVLASLNHNNIATLHGFEKEGDTSFLVMELVEGETLADRIKRGAIPVDEALALFLQIAEGLEAAHEKGVIHRDLKPANIKVSEDGKVKILDFGLAKAMAVDTGESDAASMSMSPTLTLAATQRGEILGTAAYMSPEQASGKAVDKRTDIWAFGACLYEALTGERAFHAEDAPNTLAAVLRDDPDLALLPADTGARLRRLLRRCLAKRPSERLHDIADARLVLGETDEDAPDLPAIAKLRSTVSWAAASGFGLALLLASILWVTIRPSSQDRASLRVDVRLAEAIDGAVATSVAFSQDGRSIAYVIRGRANDERELYVRSLDSLNGRKLASGSVFHPFFSRDGQWVAFFTNTALFKVPVSGGTPTELAPAQTSSNGDWSENDTIVFYSGNTPGGLVRVSADGGEMEALTEGVTDGLHHVSPQVLPGGRSVLFTEFEMRQGTADPSNPSAIRVLDLETRATKTIVSAGAHARYVPTGHLVYLDDGSLFAMPFDLDALATKGTPTRTSIKVFTTPQGDQPAYGFSRSGSLIHIVAAESYSNRVVWVDRSGNATPLLEPGLYGGPRLSPDATRLALIELRDGNIDVYVHDLDSGTETRLTFDEARDDDVVWSRDGEFVIFNSLRGNTDGHYTTDGLYRKKADGSGDVELLLLHEEPGEVYPSSVGRHGEIAYGQVTPDSDGDILVLAPNSDAPEPVAATEAKEGLPMFSPNGSWIAYESIGDAGNWEVYARPYPPGPGLFQISKRGGRYPTWAADGRELFYATEKGVVAVALVSDGTTLRPGNPVELFGGYSGGSLVGGEGYKGFDVAPDGQGFVVVEPPSGLWGNDSVRLVTNWFEELERLVPTE